MSLPIDIRPIFRTRVLGHFVPAFKMGLNLSMLFFNVGSFMLMYCDIFK